MTRKTTYSDEELTKIEYRIAKIRKELCEDNNTLFAEKLGIAKQTASNLCGGKKSVGKRTVDKILNTFPTISKKWLLLGEGCMYNNSNMTHTGDIRDNSVGGDLLGHGATKNDSIEIQKLVDTIAILTETNRQQSEQISKLIDIIASKQ